jgi:hypothetical protein
LEDVAYYMDAATVNHLLTKLGAIPMNEITVSALELMKGSDHSSMLFAFLAFGIVAFLIFVCRCMVHSLY